MGQQLRVRIKRKRRRAYLKRRKIARKVAQRGTPKARVKKQPGPVE